MGGINTSFLSSFSSPVISHVSCLYSASYLPSSFPSARLIPSSEAAAS